MPLTTDVPIVSHLFLWVGSMVTYLNGPAAIGPRLADQLLLPLALAGQGSLSTTALTNHMQTNIRVIEQFLQVSFGVTKLDQGETVIEVIAA